MFVYHWCENHPAFVQMQDIFGEDVVAKFNRIADEIKKDQIGNSGGGDSDLFAFSDSENFFVDVKHRDNINLNQAVAFPLIEKICGVEVKLARIVEVDIS